MFKRLGPFELSARNVLSFSVFDGFKLDGVARGAKSAIYARMLGAVDASTEEFWLHPRLQTAAWLFEGPIDYFHLDGHSKPANRPDASLARKLHPEMPGSTQNRGRL